VNAIGLIAALIASAAWGTADPAAWPSRRLTTIVAVARSQGLAIVLAGLLVLVTREAVPPPASLAWSLVAGAAACVAIISFFHAMAVGEMSLVAPLVAVLVTTATATAIVAVRRPQGIPGVRVAWTMVVASGVADVVGFGAFLFAEAHGPTSLAVVISSLAPVTTVVLALLVLREHLSRTQAMAIALGLLGVGLIAV